MQVPRKTIALTRRFDSSLSSVLANFCIQTGIGTTINDTDFPVRLCLRSTGEVNIGTSQSKTQQLPNNVCKTKRNRQSLTMN